MKWYLAILLTALVLGPGCSKESPPVPERGEAKLATAEVAVREVVDALQSAGTVEPRREAMLSARLMGQIQAINADEGDRVNKGETLVVIDSAEIRAKRSEAEHAGEEGRAALREAQAALANADINYSRMKALYDEAAVSRKELDDMTAQQSMAEARVAQVEARIAQADAVVKQADVMLGYSVITAPVSGLVVSKTAHVGEMATPGMPLMKLVDDSELRLVTTVKESGITGLRIGDSVTVALDALSGTELTGRVSEIVPAADPATRSFTVKIDLPSTPGVMPGTFGRANLPTGTRKAVSLPDGALTDREGVEGVYVVGPDGVVRFQAVRLGEKLEYGREVLSGLAGGETVAVGDLSGVREGMKAAGK